MDIFSPGSAAINATAGVASTPIALNGGGNYLMITVGRQDILMTVGGADVTATTADPTVAFQNVKFLAGSIQTVKLPVALNSALAFAVIRASDATANGTVQLVQGNFGQ